MVMMVLVMVMALVRSCVEGMLVVMIVCRWYMIRGLKIFGQRVDRGLNSMREYCRLSTDLTTVFTSPAK